MCEEYIKACEEYWDKYDKYDILGYDFIYDNETEEVIDEVPIYDDGSNYSEWYKKEVLHFGKETSETEEKR